MTALPTTRTNPATPPITPPTMGPILFDGGACFEISLEKSGWSAGEGESVALDVAVERILEDLVTELGDTSESV